MPGLAGRSFVSNTRPLPPPVAAPWPDATSASTRSFSIRRKTPTRADRPALHLALVGQCSVVAAGPRRDRASALRGAQGAALRHRHHPAAPRPAAPARSIFRSAPVPRAPAHPLGGSAPPCLTRRHPATPPASPPPPACSPVIVSKVLLAIRPSSLLGRTIKSFSSLSPTLLDRAALTALLTRCQATSTSRTPGAEWRLHFVRPLTAA